MRRVGLLVLLFVGALALPLGVSAPAHAADLGYTDGTQCQGPFCPGSPPPTDPVWAPGQECKIDIVDPPSFVYVTEHFVYGTTPPPAGVVPVVADVSATFPYHGEAPAFFRGRRLGTGRRQAGIPSRHVEHRRRRDRMGALRLPDARNDDHIDTGNDTVHRGNDDHVDDGRGRDGDDLNVLDEHVGRAARHDEYVGRTAG